MRGLHALAGIVFFQAAWFACVALAARGLPLAGIAVVGAYVAVELARSAHRTSDFAMLAVAIGIGAAWDTALLRAGLVAYATTGPRDDIVPAWVVAMWAQFAMALAGPLRALHGRPWLATALGAVGGPAAYAAAARMGACVLAGGLVPVAVLAVGWAVFTPLLVEVAGRLAARKRA